MSSDFIYALLGGALIGIASSILLLFNGKIMGISGIIEGLLFEKSEVKSFYLPAILGLLSGGAALVALKFPAFSGSAETADPSLAVIAIAGLLVGFGTRMGGGCTSGHGICGLSRLSPRSVIATASFMGGGVVAATVMHFL